MTRIYGYLGSISEEVIGGKSMKSRKSVKSIKSMKSRKSINGMKSINSMKSIKSMKRGKSLRKVKWQYKSQEGKLKYKRKRCTR